MSEPATAPEYADTRDHLLDELVRIDLCLRRHVEGWWADRDPQRGEFTGLFVSDEEVDGLLATAAEARDSVRGPADRSGEPTQETAGQLESVTAFVRRRAAHSIEAGVELRLFSLAAEFDLTPLEADALLLALAPDMDPKYEKVYGYLRDDATKKRPTVDLLLRVLTQTDHQRLAVMDAFSERSTLVCEGLIRVEPGPTNPSREVRVPARVVAYLLGNDEVAGSIADVATVARPGTAETNLFIGDDQQDAIDEIGHELREPTPRRAPDWLRAETPPDAVRDDLTTAASDPSPGGTPRPGRPVFAAFVGPDERAAEVAVNHLCDDGGIPILRIDASALSGSESGLAVIGREARLQSAAIHVASIDALERERRSPSTESRDPDRVPSEGDGHIEQVVTALDRFPGTVFLSGDASISADLQPRLDRHRFTHVRFPRPDHAHRKAIWHAVGTLPDDADPATLAGTFRLSRGGIEDAVATARSLTNGTLTAAALREACRLHSRRGLDELATEIEPTYEWDDIVLPPDTLAHLREITGAIRQRGTVFEAWGFADRFSLGNGINVLFTGKSGTGKTMAAEIIAGDVGLPLYKLDLSRIISKYIGETEKNLGRVFDAAADSNAILFFDEADALFGTRTEISDSHDRYANVEVDYLLQRMEEHDGCVILASNLKENIDDAFQRRINATIDFPVPDEEARREIWGLIFPAETPTGEIDIEFMARFELSGGYIKNVALTAAFLAAEDGEAVGMEHLVRALRREFQKTGKLYDVESFGEYKRVVQ